MKKILLYGSLLLTSSIFAANTTKFEVESTVGYNRFDGDSKMQNKILYGIRGTMYPNSYFAYRLSYQRGDNVHYDSSKYFSKANTDLQRFGGDILLTGDKEYDTIPYVIFGAGYESLSDETIFDVSQSYLDLGIGFKYMAKNGLNFNLETVALRKFDTSDIDLMINFGLGYMFGANKTDKESINQNYIHVPKVLKSNEITSIESKKPLKSSIEIEKRRTFASISNIAPIQSSTTISNDDNIDALYSFDEEKTNKYDDSISNYNGRSTIKEKVVEQTSDLKHYFVQMEVLYNNTDNRLLNKIKSKGYKVHIKDAIRMNKNVQLLLVGPYKNSHQAYVASKRLRKIKRDAFVTKL